MTYTNTQVSRRPAPALRTADVAGIAWPVYKLEALALGVLVFVGTLAFAGSLHAAVLAGAAATVATWWTLRLTELGATGAASARQTAGPQ
ncbi:hypothetical protein MTX35_10980 [Rhodococcus sp. ARC_M12]|uniref:Uncharacterized protein n=1 Tax=Rhodococcus navarretei TaxID=3128981 RepID=A0ABU9CY70_9NOCA|nr:hypothetical protein [Rhodococcus sp. ARC_M12]MCJ0978229.1 hypothetical protein [Rhodococcus sp. ARC_M12]